jgi:hypothetical protein
LTDGEKRELIKSMEELITKVSNSSEEKDADENGQENDTAEKNLSQTKQEAIDLITAALNCSLKPLNNNDLVEFNRN